MKSYFCQDEFGQIAPVYSISAGLDYPGIGPEHAMLHDTGRAEYVAVTDEEAVSAFEYLSRTEGIIPAIESAHAVAHAVKLAPAMGKDKVIVINIPAGGTRTAPPSPGTEGRRFPNEPYHRRVFPREGVYSLPHLRGPGPGDHRGGCPGHGSGGADLIELGIPFSDPTAEVPVIQAANQRALAAGATTDKIFEMVRRLRKDVTTPMVFMTYANVVFSYGTERFVSTAAEAGMDGLILQTCPTRRRGSSPRCAGNTAWTSSPSSPPPQRDASL